MRVPSVLSLLITPEPPEGLRRVLVDMWPWCVALADEPDMSPVAYVATSPSAPGLRRALASRRPVAVWVRNKAEEEAARALRVQALLTSDPTIAEHDEVLAVPAEVPVDVDQITPVAPFVRARMRRAYRLPEELVVDLRNGQVPQDLQPTALSVCSACIAAGEGLLTALAWGAPTVTDAHSAAALCAGPGVEVEVAASSDQMRAATMLAADPLRAASLSRLGRRLAEARCSTARIAPLLADRLGLSIMAAYEGWGRVEVALNSLQTPAESFVRRRARSALIPLGES